MESCDVVRVGQYVVIERQNYMKLHKVTEKAMVSLGQFQLDLKAIIGKPLWKTYRMEPKPNSKKMFTLVECDNAASLVDRLVGDYTGGTDNRNIVNDGRSQALSTEDILGLRDGGMSGQDIVECLIENSKTFKDKPEYSQVKYLRKKEKKYFEYVTIRKPSLRLVAQILYNQDPNGVAGLRTDTLSQMISAASIHSQGTYLLYDSAFQGLPTAAILTHLGPGGNLIRLHPGNIPQKQAVVALNFNREQLERLINVSMSCFLQKMFQKGENEASVVATGAENGNAVESNDSSNTIQDVNNDLKNVGVDSPGVREDSPSVQDNTIVEETRTNPGDSERIIDCATSEQSRKRNLMNEEGPVTYKRPRWELETERALDILRNRLTDGLIVVAREDPTNIVKCLLHFVHPSRPFVVYSPIREPLMELYVYLKSKCGVVGARLTETWTRTYQVLPDRTHPDITMPGAGGYLLTGTVVEKDS